MVQYGNLHRGFEYPLIRFAVISESDIFGANAVKKRHRKNRQKYDGSRVSSLSELSLGDFVVHEEHGLGIYRGIEKIEADGVTKDYIKIEYRDGDNCYVPATRLDAIQKYASGDVEGAETEQARRDRMEPDQIEG
jgi:transcription-repair coupling factor (superfamily II helicase)